MVVLWVRVPATMASWRGSELLEDLAKAYRHACWLHEPAYALTAREVALRVEDAKTASSDYWTLENSFIFFFTLILRPEQPSSEEKLKDAYSL